MFETIGKYKIMGMIERGGSATVYLGHEPLLDIQVAIKVFTVKNPNFALEAKRLHDLASYAHIISFMDYGFVSQGSSDTELPYLVMPYCKRSLASILGRDLRLSVSKSLKYGLQLAQGLKAIHKAGLLHLDLKPGNIMLDDHDNLLIIDFGISQTNGQKYSESNKTATEDSVGLSPDEMTGYGIGTKYYASPEQLSGNIPLSTLTPKADFFSLGVILHRCLFGHCPSEASEFIGTNENAKAFYDFLSQLLASTPDDRPDSIDEIISSLKSFVLIADSELSELISALNVRENIQNESISHEKFTNDGCDASGSATDAVSCDDTREWKPKDAVNSVIQNQLSATIRDLLKQSGAVEEDDYQRLSLLMKAEMHEKYSETALLELIRRIRQQLMREDTYFARYVLWLEQVDLSLNEAVKQGLSIEEWRTNSKVTSSDYQGCAQRVRLLRLGKTVLSADVNTEAILTTKESYAFGSVALELESEPELKLTTKQEKEFDEQQQTKSVGKSAVTNAAKNTTVHRAGRIQTLLSWRYAARFSAVILLLVLSALIPNVEQFSSQSGAVDTEAERLNSTALNQSIISDSESDSASTNALSTAPETKENQVQLPLPIVKLLVDVMPRDATISLQATNGSPVDINAVTPGSYILRISKNGYKTLRRELSVPATSELRIKEILTLSDSRYFIGNTDKTVADGIPVEFILLPTSERFNQTIRMMSTEVTNELYTACVLAGACSTSSRLSTDPRAEIFSRGDHPVVNVSWFDIEEKFIPWLSSVTNSQLRLPTEKEWVYAALAGHKSQNYAWGNNRIAAKAHCKQCNLYNQALVTYRSSTAPVQTFSPNEWQLYDLHGNVQEWTQDCAITEGRVKQTRCDQAVVKGGAWFSSFDSMSAQQSTVLKKTVRTHTTGFRLVEVVGQNNRQEAE